MANSDMNVDSSTVTIRAMEKSGQTKVSEPVDSVYRKGVSFVPVTQGNEIWYGNRHSSQIAPNRSTTPFTTHGEVNMPSGNPGAVASNFLNFAKWGLLQKAMYVMKLADTKGTGHTTKTLADLHTQGLLILLTPVFTHDTHIQADQKKQAKDGAPHTSGWASWYKLFYESNMDDRDVKP